MAIRRKAKNGLIRTLLGVGVIASTMNDTQAQELKMVDFTEETKEKYQIYQDKFKDVDVGEDVATNLAKMVGRIPFTLPVSCMSTEMFVGSSGARVYGNQLIQVDEGLNKVSIEYDSCRTYVEIEGILAENNPNTNFSDVADDRWSSDSIKDAVKSNLLKGVSSDTFAPSQTLSTASALTGLNRVMMNNLDFDMKTSRFIIDDLFQFIDNNHWAYNHILNIASKLDGEDVLMYASYGNRIYKEEMSRGTMARLVYQLFSDKGFSYNEKNIGFTDVNKDIESVNFVVNTGIMVGYGTNEFRPNDTLSREEFATILMRIDNLYKHK